MRIFTWLLMAIAVSTASNAQAGSFPQAWVGNWKGELNWYRGTAKEPQKVMMELRIHPADSVNKYTWQLIYGGATEDNRPYNLIAKDTAKGHWVIDENNGIILDQFWVANRLTGAFTVQASTIINTYWMEGGRLIAEFYSLSAKPISTTGKGTQDSPSVDSYKIGSYQVAILTRQ